MINFFIPYNVPSSKNSKQIVWREAKGKRVPLIVHSKTTRTYIKDTKGYYEMYAKVFKEEVKHIPTPLHIRFTFFRGSKRKFDYINPAQTVQDLMVKYEWIEDDNAEYIIPYFAQYKYDKENPGVLIEIINDNHR